MVVDDDSSMRRAMTRLLTAAGYEVSEFGSAEALLLSGKAEEASCVVSDVQLPLMSGVALIRELRRRSTRLPAVFVTGFDGPAVRRQASAFEGVAYLVKPFEGTALLRAISKVSRDEL
jgi:FixJ family two-component response regulator